MRRIVRPSKRPCVNCAKKQATKAKMRGSSAGFSNPAIMSNVCYTVLVENCKYVCAVEFDHGEDLLTKLVPVREIPGLVAAGKIQHSLVVVGLHYFDLW